MIKCGNVWLNPSTIVAIIPSVKIGDGANVPIITADGVSWEEADACTVKFVGGGGAPVDCKASVVAKAIDDWAYKTGVVGE